MKRTISLLLALAMLFALCGCTSKEDLYGTWEAKDYLTSDEVRGDLVYLEFFDDEISYANFDAYYLVETVELTENEYILTYDEAATIAAIKAYLKDFFTRLYDNRTRIASYEGYFDDITSPEEFLACYADIFFGYADYDELLNDMATDIYDTYDIPYDSGKCEYDMADKWIEVDRYRSGSTTHITTIDFELDGDMLTLHFKNETTTYTKR